MAGLISQGEPMFIRWQPHNWAEARTLLSAGGAGGEGGGGGGGNEGRTKERASDLVDRYNGDAVKMAEKLADALNDNYTLRRKRDDLQGEVTRLSGNQKPEGATILTGDEASAYEAYKGFGKPEEIKTRLEERDRLAQEVTTAKRDGTLRDAAQRYGYDYEALRAHTGDLPLTPYEADEDGKKLTKYRIGADKDAADMAEWVGKQPAYVGRALAVTANGQGQQTGAVRYPAQGSGQPPSDAERAAAVREEQERSGRYSPF